MTIAHPHKPSGKIYFPFWRWSLAQNVTLYRQDKAERYSNITDASVEYGTLTFHWKPTPLTVVKVTTTVPFLLEEEVA
jgi:hypothetical protein